MDRDEIGFPFPDCGGAGPAAEFSRISRESFVPVRLPNGTSAALVCGHDELRQLLTDERFSRAGAAAHGMSARSTESLALNSADPPDHTRRRRVVTGAFTARRAEALRPAVRRAAGDLVAGLITRRSPAELIADFSLPLAVGVICRIMGVPFEDWPRFQPLVEVMMSTGGHPPETVRTAHAEMFAYFAELFDAGAAGGGDGGEDTVLRTIVEAVLGDVLGRDEAIHLAYGLLMAGYETTSNQLAICVYQLLSDCGRWESLRGAPAATLRQAVDELVRLTSLPATGGVPHVAVADTAIGGREVRAGQVLVPVFAAANRDPRVFADPDEIRLDRDGPGHLAFGHGRHVCLGAPLARVELEEALDVLLRELPGLELAVPESELRWRSGTFIRGLTALPVRWPEYRTIR